MTLAHRNPQTSAGAIGERPPGLLAALRGATESATLTRRIGRVRRVNGLAIEADGPDVAVGAVCEIVTRSGSRVLAEVVGLRPGAVTLMPYAPLAGLAVDCDVVATEAMSTIGVGEELLGRVVDGFGLPLDGRPAPAGLAPRPLLASPLNPMDRPPIREPMGTGVRAIDALLTLGRGQRLGIFAGSGVGKSTLLGMIARHVTADVNVIALIGERGREVREFVERQLTPEGLARSVVVVATSDQPALARLRAAHAAVAIAEHFRDQGRHVLLTMDSITRFAMARREVGLAAGEPPTARGYTPSVFAELPQLCERCGTAPSGGSITALLTVLVEGDDFNEPVSDMLRATLDGHVVLSRKLAQRAHFPAIDVLQSVSRVMPDVVDGDAVSVARDAVRLLAQLDRHRQMVDMGAYVAGTNAELDRALRLESGLAEFLQQSADDATRDESGWQLRELLGEASRA